MKVKINIEDALKALTDKVVKQQAVVDPIVEAWEKRNAKGYVKLPLIPLYYYGYLEGEPRFMEAVRMEGNRDIFFLSVYKNKLHELTRYKELNGDDPFEVTIQDYDDYYSEEK